MATAGEWDVEHIPDADFISRTFYGLPAEIDPESVLPFPYEAGERAESAVWRKYAPEAEEIHQRGLSIAEAKNERRKMRNQPLLQYIGSRTVKVELVRAIRSERGHGFDVVHLPERGDRAHAHIAMRPANGANLKTIKNDIRELVALLFQSFGELEPYSK